VTCVWALLIVGVLVGIVGAVGYFVLWPFMQAIDRLEDEG